MVRTGTYGSWLSAGATLLVLVACAAPAPQPDAEFRVVRSNDVELRAAAAGSQRRSFEQFDIEGEVGTGVWSIESVVQHSGLRCATYEIGLQIGRGAPACQAVEWHNAVQYGTRERHCNSSSLVHRGGGTHGLSGEQLTAATCVRVVTRCAGACG